MDNGRREKLMANCICFKCKRPMDCTGERYCELCEADAESAWVEVIRQRTEKRLKQPTG